MTRITLNKTVKLVGKALETTLSKNLPFTKSVLGSLYVNLYYNGTFLTQLCITALTFLSPVYNESLLAPAICFTNST